MTDAAEDDDDQLRELLLDDDDELTARFEEVLTEIFQRFDAASDGVLDEAELQSYARACNAGSEFDEDELQQMRDFFDCDDSGNLTLEGFKQMYQTQSGGEPAETLKDLKSLGYGPTLAYDPVANRPPAEQFERATTVHVHVQL